MKRTLLLLPLLAAAAPVALPQPPVFPPGTTTDTIHGTVIADPYRALENAADPKVQAWSDAEDARTRAWLAARAGRAQVQARLSALIHATSPSDRNLQARGARIFEIYADPAKQQPSLAVLDAGADPASRRLLLDPNTIDTSGHTAIDWYAASPDGSKVAVSLSKNGSEDGTVHVYDAATGREIGAPIPRVQYPTAGGSLAWAADNASFWYTRYPGEDAPEADRHFNLQVFFHKLGANAAHDTLVLGTHDGVPRTGEIFLSNDFGGPAALASVQLGDGGQWQHWVLTRNAKAQKIGEYADRVVGGAVIAKDGTVFGTSRRDAPMGRVVRLAPPYTGGLAQAETIIPAEADAAVIDGGEFGTPLTLSGGRLWVNRVSGGPNTLTVSDLDGHNPQRLATPPVSGIAEVDSVPNGGVLFDVTTFTAPRQFLRYDAASGRVGPTELREISPVSFADAEVRRITATSRDGTKVPVSVVLRRGTALDGTHPLLLIGYGGFGISSGPGFLDAIGRMWLNAGGSIAKANIRGGGEFGAAWHENGMLLKKQNVFNDFAAAAQTLIDEGYTSQKKLALLGGSNGGLLMGAMITQHPGLARAVVSAVGIYDMMRLELDPNGVFNTTEYGTIQNPGAVCSDVRLFALPSRSQRNRLSRHPLYRGSK